MENKLNFIATDLDRPQFDNLQNELRRELAPQGFLEEEVFQTLLQAAWNRRRVIMVLADLASSTNNPAADPLADASVAKQYDRYSQYESRYERNFARALKELRTLQTSRSLRRYIDAKENPVPASPAVEVGKVLQFAPKPPKTPKPLTPKEAVNKAIQDIENESHSFMLRFRAEQLAENAAKAAAAAKSSSAAPPPPQQRRPDKMAA